MVFYLIGLGLCKDSISANALTILKNSDEVYLENYTVDFPYSKKELEEFLNVKIILLNREEVESEDFLKNAKEKNIALLVYGDPLSATTHIQLVISCKKQKIPYKIFHNSSILTAISETGLSLYKFGKTTSMPNWDEHKNKPTSFAEYIKENLSINAHTLILTDIGLDLKNALLQLKQASKEINLPEKIFVVSNVGTEKQGIFYDSVENLKKKNIGLPFCLVIPGELHFLEKEGSEKFKD